jgi:hypothetical protein
MLKQLVRTSLVTLTLIGLLSILSPVGLFGVGSVSAQNTPAPAPAVPQQLPTARTVNCPSGQEHPIEHNGKDLDKQSCCPSLSSGQSPTGTQCFITKYLNPLINLLSAFIGIAIVISIIVAGIQYSSSAGDPGKAAAARDRITASVSGLAAFIFLFAFLQWVIPGGLLK